MADQPQPLGAEDYQQIYALMTSGDAGQQKQGKLLASKLTPAEGQQFFDFQQSLHAPGKDATSQRADSNIVSVGSVGIAPEDALMGGMAVRGIAKAASVGGVVGAAKEAFATAHPILKYEITRRGLQSLGVPEPLAMLGAAAVSGYKGAGKGESPTVARAPAATSDLELARSEAAAGRLPQGVVDAMERSATARAARQPVTPSPEATQPPTQSQVASAPAVAPPSASPAPAPPPATDMQGQPAVTAQPPVAEPPPTKPMSLQRIRNDVGLAVRRAKTTFSDADYKAAETAVRAGADPLQAVADIVKLRMSPVDALKASTSFAGLPTDAEAQAAMAKRNYKNSAYRTEIPK